MGNELQEGHQEQTSIQVKVQDIRLQWTSGVWKKCTETYSPVVTWFYIKLMLNISVVKQWHTLHVDLVIAYQQALVEHDLYMSLPKSTDMITGKGKTYVLKLINNLCGQNQDRRACIKCLRKKLLLIGFKQSYIDACIFFWKHTISRFYMDDEIYLVPYNG